MKAKELAAKYKIRPQDNPSREDLTNGLIECAGEIVREIGAIIKARRIKEGESCVAVIREQDQKYAALVRICVDNSKDYELSGHQSTVFRRMIQLAFKNKPFVWTMTCQRLGWDVDYAPERDEPKEENDNGQAAEEDSASHPQVGQGGPG